MSMWAASGGKNIWSINVCGSKIAAFHKGAVWRLARKRRVGYVLFSLPIAKLTRDAQRNSRRLAAQRAPLRVAVKRACQTNNPLRIEIYDFPNSAADYLQS